MIFGFENENIMGRRVTNVTYRKLVELGAVTPYEVVLLAVTREDIKSFINSNTWVRDEMFMENEDLQTRFIASIIMADKAFKSGYTKKMLTFHSRNAHATNFEKAIINLQKDKVFTSFEELDFIGRCMGGQTMTNKALLDMLEESNKGIISNARVLTEGVSVPCIDSVLFCDPKTSPVDLAQGISRAIRLYPGKKIAKVFLPVIVDYNGNIEQAAFQQMVDILDLLAGFDEALESEINVAIQSQNRIRMTSNRIINTDEIELDNIDVNEFYNNLSLAFWTRVKSSNGYWDNEERLRQYASDKTTRTELTEIDAALRRLEANDYQLWKKLCPHIPLPTKKRTWKEKEDEASKIALNYTGTYSQFREDYPDVISTFHGIAEMASSPYSLGIELINKYCSHMERKRYRWKHTTSDEIIREILSKCKYKSDLKAMGFGSLGQKLKRYAHLKDAYLYYQNIPNAKTGLKVGTRRGGGWTHN